MILSVEELKKYVSTDKTDEVLEEKLQALESFVRKHTNNNFIQRGIETKCPIMAQKLYTDYSQFHVGDTVQIAYSKFNDGVYTITGIENGYVQLNKEVIDESGVLVVRVDYPLDIKMGVVELMRWDLENKSKVGIQSETISRHSVTYYDMSGDGFDMGYPKSLLGFLRPYKKARF